MNITFIYDCECGGVAKHRMYDSTQKGREVEIDFTMSCSQIDLQCEKCGKKYYTGDIEVLSEDEI